MLNAQLQNALKAAPATPASPPAPGVGPLGSAHTQSDAAAVQRATAEWPLLRLGSQGESVRTVQYLLREHGATVVVDGDFGMQTDGAVRAFQQTKGLAADGVVRQPTWEALTLPLVPERRGEAVRALQSQLAARGLEVVVDGDFGPQTLGAVFAYKTARGLPPHHVVDTAMWALLVNGK